MQLLEILFSICNIEFIVVYLPKILAELFNISLCLSCCQPKFIEIIAENLPPKFLSRCYPISSCVLDLPSKARQISSDFLHLSFIFYIFHIFIDFHIFSFILISFPFIPFYYFILSLLSISTVLSINILILTTIYSCLICFLGMQNIFVQLTNVQLK